MQNVPYCKVLAPLAQKYMVSQNQSSVSFYTVLIAILQHHTVLAN